MARRPRGGSPTRTSSGTSTGGHRREIQSAPKYIPRVGLTPAQPTKSYRRYFKKKEQSFETLDAIREDVPSGTSSRRSSPSSFVPNQNNRRTTLRQDRERILERSGAVGGPPKKFSGKNAVKARDKKMTRDPDAKILRKDPKCRPRPDNTKGSGGSRRFAGNYCKKG